MSETQHHGLPKPDDNPTDKQSLVAALLAVALATDMIDELIHGLALALSGKANNDHSHAIEGVDGLVDALNGKMPANATFLLGDLDGVDLPEAIPNGYILAFVVDKWIAASAASVLGVHGHSVDQVQGLDLILDAKAPVKSPDFLETPRAPTASPGTNTKQLATTAFVQAALSDFWALQPLGVPIGVLDNIGGVAAPPVDKAYRYIKLTASDSYNAGVLVGESVSGSAPNLTAVATVNLSASPLNGRVVPLINTDRRFLRAGAAGTKEQSQNLSHGHPGSTAGNSGSHSHTYGTYAGGGASGGSNVAEGFSNPRNGSPSTDPSGVHTHPLTIAEAGGNEARPANLGLTFYVRIR